MNGRIWVESEEGKGSAFHFTLAVKATARKNVPAALPELANTSVLIVEDHLTARRVLRETLTAWGMRVGMAGSILQAVAAVKRAKESGTPFSVVLVDVSLPDGDSFSIVERQNRAMEGSLPTIFMLRPSTKVADAARTREVGAAGFITKPLRQQELRETIRSVLGRSSRVSSFQLLPRHSDTTAEKRSTRPLRILLVEDNPVNQKLTLRLLEKRGHSVMAVGDGVEALDAVAHEKFDLVLMDIQMPKLDGFQVTALIRERELVTGEHLAIVAMTANVLKGDEERCLKAGMDRYIPKPINAKNLFDVIEKLSLSASTASA